MKVSRLAAKPKKRATMHGSTSVVVGSETLDSLMLTENVKGYTVHYS